MTNFAYIIKRFIYLFYGEKFFKKHKFNWSDTPLRHEILNKIISKKHYKNYLEIGCFKNENFDQIIIDKKIGVDPVSGGTLRMTSDEFFIKNNDTFDIIFIDGLHHYEQVKKDIENSLKFLNKSGVILLHDCLPKNVFEQAVPRCTYNWNGDVWKAIVEARCREDIDTYTCFADQGIGAILKRPNKNLLNLKIQNFKKLKFYDYYNNHQNYMNIINHNELLNILKNE